MFPEETADLGTSARALIDTSLFGAVSPPKLVDYFNSIQCCFISTSIGSTGCLWVSARLSVSVISVQALSDGADVRLPVHPDLTQDPLTLLQPLGPVQL